MRLVCDGTDRLPAAAYATDMKRSLWILIPCLVLAACSPAAPAQPAPPASTPERAASEPVTDEAVPQPTYKPDGLNINRRGEDFEGSVPPQLVPLDGIRPVYEPEFLTASEAPLKDEELVIGLAMDGVAKAYPITVLRFREMVNDELRGIPTLVTW